MLARLYRRTRREMRWLVTALSDSSLVAPPRAGAQALRRRIVWLRQGLVRLKQFPRKMEEEQRVLRQMLELNAQSLRWLAEATTAMAARLPDPRPALPSSAPSPLVSIVMPTWNRAEIITRALRSVQEQTYQNWECLIVDDGSEDDTRQVIAPWLADPRFRYFAQPHSNAAIARNLALRHARGEIIAYLDSDNYWLAHYLAVVVAAFAADPNTQSVYTAQVVERADSHFSNIHSVAFDYAQLQRGNFIDLNVFSHRAALVGRWGGFDETLASLQDWDLILRYTREDKITRLNLLGGVYWFGARNQITHNAAHAHSAYRVRRKTLAPVARPLKVLYAVWHYPHLSESYVRVEVQAALKLGVEVEVWSEEPASAPFISEVPVHRGRLEDAIAKFRPDVVQTHWLDMALKFAEIVGRAGLPLTVRGHGFEFSPSLIAQLDTNPTIKAVYVFPHQMARLNGVSPKIKALPAIFNPDLYQPHKEKDRRLVLRTGCALPSKDYASFMKAAQLCPGHRFVLNVCLAFKLESYLDTVHELNRSMGNPVEIIANLQHEEVAELMKQAGIYLHTAFPKGPKATPFGMPISISEAMATGSYLVGRRCPGAAEYIGPAGALYDTPEEAAALIRATTQWSDEQWHQAFTRSVDRAYREFVDVETVRKIVADWEALASPPRKTQPEVALNPNLEEVVR